MAKETPHNPAPLGAKQRPPIVVIMGHVDHGKTTLLDYIRKASVAAREAGGITQAVGAYEIEHIPAGGVGPRKITFIDTPGHEAFTAMRSRGAQAADLAILVVAADEGMKPQTKEAIKIIEESKTPYIVAFNKIDKTNGSIDKARNDLMAAGVLLEGFGGQVSFHGISAKTGDGVSDLLDLILLAADLENLTYHPSVPATGFILEARRDPRRGIEASVIIKEGTLKRGDPIMTHTAAGKVKILENFLGKAAAELEPSAPAIVIGFEKLPKVGEGFSVGILKDMKPVDEAPKVVPQQLGRSKPNTLNLILKAGDAGSLEVLSAVLRNVEHEGKKEVNVVDEAVGDITDGDVKRAMATNATIIGFKNKAEKAAKVLADAQEITIITSDIVYDLSKAVEEFLSGARGPAAAGELEVLAVFSQDKLDKQLVGGRVMSGIFRGKSQADILRPPGPGIQDSKISLGVARITGLREKKLEIAQADKGKEIGVLVGSPVQIQIGDKLVIRK